MIGIWRASAANAIVGASETTSSPTMIVLIDPLLSAGGRSAKVFEVSTCASKTGPRSDRLWSHTGHAVNHHGVTGRGAPVRRRRASWLRVRGEAGSGEVGTNASHTRCPAPVVLHR